MKGGDNPGQRPLGRPLGYPMHAWRVFKVWQRREAGRDFTGADEHDTRDPWPQKRRRPLQPQRAIRERQQVFRTPHTATLAADEQTTPQGRTPQRRLSGYAGHASTPGQIQPNSASCTLFPVTCNL